MSEQFRKNVQTIAKTKELTEKVDRALISAEEYKKEQIKTLRSIATQNSDGGLATTGLGDNATDGNQTGTGSGGGSSNIPGNSATVPEKVETDLTTILDQLTLDSNNKGTSLSQDPNGTNTDANTSGGSIGGSQAKDQAELGINNADWQAIEAAMTANGASTEEIAQARKEFLQKELGIHEVGDLFTQQAVKLAQQNALQLRNGYLQNIRNEVLKGVTGVDKDNNPVLVRLDGQIPKPSDADAAADNQNPWTLYDTPPTVVGFESGYYWLTATSTPAYMAWPYDHEAISGAIVSQNFGASGQSGSPGSLFGPNSFGNYYLYVAVDSVSATQYEVILKQANIGGSPIGPEFSAFFINKTACGGTPPAEADAICLLEDLKENRWPKTGLYVVYKSDGKFKTYQLDSEAPLAAQLERSVIEIKSLSTGDTYKIEPTNSGGNMLYESIASPEYALVFDSQGALVDVAPPFKIPFIRPR